MGEPDAATTRAHGPRSTEVMPKREALICPCGKRLLRPTQQPNGVVHRCTACGSYWMISDRLLSLSRNPDLRASYEPEGGGCLLECPEGHGLSFEEGSLFGIPLTRCSTCHGYWVRGGDVSRFRMVHRELSARRGAWSEGRKELLGSILAEVLVELCLGLLEE